MKPIEFMGLAKLLGVSVMKPVEVYTSTAAEPSEMTQENQPDKPKAEPRPFTDVLEDVMARFSTLNRQRRREILKLVKKANTKHLLGDDS
jgi:hypothetical protein